ncbi:hypothetical protein LWI28_014389 [Acer negundo]|uniref:Transposase n=1 Tax=Acer negundo TaxID=4023 RepID=A0AAD5IMP9_ACENE|nr:hypothetical protein LWI28_014389 [Acer negundo]
MHVKGKFDVDFTYPGAKTTGYDIDVYLAPLIEDLQNLWMNGIDVYDAFGESTFNLKAILMWKINDFPAYGNMSGWPTMGKVACPVCRENTCSKWLKQSQKFSYMGHRQFLAIDHPLRSKRAWFNREHEKRRKPKLSTGKDIYDEVENFVNDWGKSEETKRKRSTSLELWKKKSIFFKLPYWKI